MILFVTKLGKSPPSSSRSTTLKLKFTCSSSPGWSSMQELESSNHPKALRLPQKLSHEWKYLQIWSKKWVCLTHAPGSKWVWLTHKSYHMSGNTCKHELKFIYKSAWNCSGHGAGIGVDEYSGSGRWSEGFMSWRTLSQAYIYFYFL